MTSETVFVATTNKGGRPHRYHTDRECRGLSMARTVHEWSKDRIERSRAELCKWCSGDGIQPRGTGDGHYESLLEAANGESRES